MGQRLYTFSYKELLHWRYSTNPKFVFKKDFVFVKNYSSEFQSSFKNFFGRIFFSGIFSCETKPRVFISWPKDIKLTQKLKVKINIKYSSDN